VTRDAVIVGAGVAGLTAAYRLAELAAEHRFPVRVHLLDAAPRPGGLINTWRGNGFLWEDGADAMVLEDAELRDLVARLGIDDQLIDVASGARRAQIFEGGRLRTLPADFHVAAPLRSFRFLRAPFLSWRGRWRMWRERFVPRRVAAVEDEESLGAFLRRRFGAEALDRLIEPLTAGVTFSDPDAVGARSSFPALVDLEARFGSVIRGLKKIHRSHLTRDLPSHWLSGPRHESLRSFHNGLSTLVDALARRLPNGALRVNTPVESVRFQTAGLQVVPAAGEALNADVACLAVPAYQAGSMLRALDPQAGDILSRVRYESCAVLNMAFSRYNVRRPLESHVIVVPAREGRTVRSLTLSSVKFPGRTPDPRVLVRAVVGGAAAHESDATLESRLRLDVSEILQIRATPYWSYFRRHFQAVPQYSIGHRSSVDLLHARLRASGLFLAGAAFDGFGVAESMASGLRAAAGMFKELQSRERTVVNGDVPVVDVPERNPADE
jgi:oxygen-dependent protoporphyrinogen oxidase